ncbi:disulfide bond formation protein B [Marinobacteraceae bacterium S3BR75-40.1]
MSSSRMVFGAVALVCAALIAVALFMEYVMGLVPCPLCMLQRLAVVTVGAVALVAALHGPRGWGVRVYGGLVTLTAAAGGAISSRQLWLQHLPEGQKPACGAGYDYIMDALPLFDALKTILQGTGDCAKVVWTFLGLSIPGWTLLAFIAMGLVGIWMAVKGGNRA